MKIDSFYPHIFFNDIDTTTRCLTCVSVIVKCSSKPPQLRQLLQLKLLLLLAGELIKKSTFVAIELHKAKT